MLAARPEVVINQLTALPADPTSATTTSALEPTNRLRREAGPILARAAAAPGARRLIAQSVAFVLEPVGPPVLDETRAAVGTTRRPRCARHRAMRVLETRR